MSKPSDAIYLTLSQTHNNPFQSISVSGAINQITNPLVKSAADYDMYVQHMSTTTDDLPYFNISQQIIDDTYPIGAGPPYDYNFLGRTNMSISIVLTDANVFDYAGNVDELTFEIPAQAETPFQPAVGANQGATAFLQYQSENTYGYENPPENGVALLPATASANYPYPYYDVHSIQQVIDMMNVAIARMWEKITNVPDNSCPYFSFDPVSQLYSFTKPVAEIGGDQILYDIYVNGFLERYLDGFRWYFYSDTDIPVLVPNGYTGLNNKLVFPFSTIEIVYPYVLQSEYSCVSNLVDINAIVIVAGGGSDFNNVEAQYIPLGTDNSTANQLPSTNAVLRFPIDPSGFTSSTNNSSIEYNAIVLDKKLVIKGNTQLRNLGLIPYFQNTKNELYPITLPCINGKFSITLALFAK